MARRRCEFPLRINGLSNCGSSNFELNNCRILVVAAAAALLTGFAASLCAQPMTLKSTAQKAIGRNPEVLARYHAYRASEGELESVAGALLPHVDLIASMAQRCWT